MNNEVAVVIGIGGMGEAIARRVGMGRELLLADFTRNCSTESRLRFVRRDTR
jgi:hypothetical protein